MIYRRLLRPLLFRLDPETAHRMVLRTLARTQPILVAARPFLAVRDDRLVMEALGLRFDNPLGVAAGMDKDAETPAAWRDLGFGFLEVGTVTPRPQPGNPRPRLFRLPGDRGVINRMGFNGAGAEVVAGHLARRPAGFTLGINLGKNRETPQDQAAEDYARALILLHALADYLVVNVSSPNTPGLRDLQAAGELESILLRVQEQNGRQGRPRPLLVKISPDLAPEAVDAVVDVAMATGCAGIVATNTTTSRAGLGPHPAAGESGGLSGAPLRSRSTEVVRRVRQATIRKGGTPLVIIGVGGITSAAAAWEKIRAGASLLQVYTGLVYEGPGLARSINRGLLRLLEREGLRHLGEAVGLDAG